jgi:uncharacterized protein (TIGR02284 family)
MSEQKSGVVSILNDLIEYCVDAEKGFEEASRDVLDADYRKVFLGNAARMKEFAADLQEQVVKVGGKPRASGGVTGDVHRVWIHFRAMLNLHHKEPVLLECEKGEESLLDHYQKALSADLPPDVRQLIENQSVEIIEIRNHLKELEEQQSAKSN